MTETDIEGWSIERNGELSILLASDMGALEINRDDDDLFDQVWYADADLKGQPPLSWKVRVEDRDELLSESIPEIINVELPKYM